MVSLEDTLGRVIAEQVQIVRHDQMTAWERVLRLHVKPKPGWVPAALWSKILSLVLIQSESPRRPEAE